MKKLLLAGIAAASLTMAPIYASAMDHGDHAGKDKAEKSYDKSEKPSIVEIAAGNEDFSTLVAALQAADLVEALQGEGPFTVFAPTNEAFEALPEGTLENLLKPENKEQLATILKYHVVGSKVKSKDAAGNEVELDTLAGIKLPVDGTGEGVVVGGANVTSADVWASNGVVHIVDAVILPPAAE